MKGFLAGSLALIVLYVAVQPGTASKAQTGSNVLVSLLQRALSPQIAGIPNRAGGAAQKFAQGVDAAAATKVGQAGQAVGGALNQQAATGAATSVGAAGGQALNNLLNPTGN